MKRIAVAVFEGAEELDFAGPWEVLTAWHFLYPDDVDVILVGDNWCIKAVAARARNSPMSASTLVCAV